MASRKRVLFVVDVPDWAYADRAKHWQHLFQDEFQIEILYLCDLPPVRLGAKAPAFLSRVNRLLEVESKSKKCSYLFQGLKEDFVSSREDIFEGEPAFDHKQYDGVLFFYHRALRDRRLLATPIPPSKIGVCVNNEKWGEVGAEQTYREEFPEAHLLLACNRYILDAFSGVHPNVRRLSQAVNTEQFTVSRDEVVRRKRVGKKLVVGWSGNYQNPIKNVELLKEACSKLGMSLQISKNRSRDELNTWYNESVDILVCVSESEGGPLMLLEAGATKRPVITTPVGLAREIVRDGKNGLIVQHGDQAGLEKALTRLADDLNLRERLAKNLHKEVCKNWSYQARLGEVRAVLRALVRRRKIGSIAELFFSS